MKTDIKKIAALVATQVWCNGEYSEIEAETAIEIAEAFELPTEEFKGLVADCVCNLEKLDEEGVSDFLAENAKEVASADAPVIYEALMQMALCDGELTRDEVSNLLASAEALGLEAESAILLLCDMVKTEPELEVSID